jgi:hypothetical protein
MTASVGWSRTAPATATRRTCTWASPGVQRPDGGVERHIIVDELGARDPLTAAEARQLARALIAADDVDRLAGGE